jgi:hypothetical protein
MEGTMNQIKDVTGETFKKAKTSMDLLKQGRA